MSGGVGWHAPASSRRCWRSLRFGARDWRRGSTQGDVTFFFLRYLPSALGFGTTLTRLADEIVLAIPNVTFVLVVPSFGLLRVGSGGFLGGAFLLRGFGGLSGIFECGEVEDCDYCCGC